MIAMIDWKTPPAGTPADEHVHGVVDMQAMGGFLLIKTDTIAYLIPAHAVIRVTCVDEDEEE